MRKKCRICRSKNLVKILDLGKMPLANAFLKAKDLNKKEIKIPLATYFCKKCRLLQLLNVADPEKLFKNYYYQTSTSPALKEHFEETAKKLSRKFIKSKNDLFIDIGGNDGTLLSAIKKSSDCRVLNIDPAKNIIKKSKQLGVESIPSFFSSNLAGKILRKIGPAKVITANNVFAHIDDIEDIVKGVKILLDKTGVFIFEVHWVANLLGLKGKYGGFDQIYHEHLNYYSLTSILNSKLFERFGLKVYDVDLLPTHGMIMRIYVSSSKMSTQKLQKFVKEEKKLKLDKIKTFRLFSKNVSKGKGKLKNILRKIKLENKKIIGYGAPGKSTTLLNYYGIDKNDIDYIIDNSVEKSKKYTPGSHIPIIKYSQEALFAEKPDYILILAWNYADSIMRREKKLKRTGVRFIIPVPEIKII